MTFIKKSSMANSEAISLDGFQFESPTTLSICGHAKMALYSHCVQSLTFAVLEPLHSNPNIDKLNVENVLFDWEYKPLAS
jgi:hypothetical protein